MKVSERREIMLKHRQRHIESLQKLGYIYSKMNAIKMLETEVNRLMVEECNGTITEEEAEKWEKQYTKHATKLFGGTLPKGFFINGDPRGYSLKLDPEAWKVSDNAQENYEAQPVKYTDWGGYMILAPEEF
jgi:hypothetical protein